MTKQVLELKHVRIGDKVWFDPGENSVGWASHGFVNDMPIRSRYGVYFPCWTERQKGEATTFMVHETNVSKIERG